MYTEWLAHEHYRMHVIEEWPDGARRNAGLAAAKSALDSLERVAAWHEFTFHCQICAARATKPLEMSIAA